MKTLTGLILTLLATTVAAQGNLKVLTTVQKEEVVVSASGESETRLVAAEVVVPGEKVFYTITFTNVSDESAENIVITNPIENHRTYVEGSAFAPGTEMLFSVDGGQSFAAANELTVTEDGTSRAAEADDFTHLRWVMKNDLAAGAQGTARFAAVVK